MEGTGLGPHTLYLQGAKRTIVQDFWPDRDDGFQFDPNFLYKICDLSIGSENVGGIIGIRLPDQRCVRVPNPDVDLNSIEGTSLILDLAVDDLEPIDTHYRNGEYILQKALTNPLCGRIPDVFQVGDEKVFGRLADGSYLQFDPRLALQMNSLKSPLPDGGKSIRIKSGGPTKCMNVPRTFLNEDTCQPSSNSCQNSDTYEELEISLEDVTISNLYTLTGRYVYRIEGLNVVDQVDGSKLDHPCKKELRSRWIPKETNSACNPTALHSSTNETLLDLISSASDPSNPYLRDIYFPSSGKSCDSRDTNPDIEIWVDGVCWKRVHEDYLSVYDMSYWAENHPGGQQAIKKWSNNGGTVLVFPNGYVHLRAWITHDMILLSWCIFGLHVLTFFFLTTLLSCVAYHAYHAYSIYSYFQFVTRTSHATKGHPMVRWDIHKTKFDYIGRYGDPIRIRDLPTDLRTDDVTKYYMDSEDTGSTTSLVCGSPGEVANDPTKGFVFDIVNGDYKSSNLDTAVNRQNVWMMVALEAKDQLRQRVAWSLAQVSTITSMKDTAKFLFLFYCSLHSIPFLQN